MPLKKTKKKFRIMKKKAAVSFPMMIVVSIIVLIIIIALYYAFLKNTESRLDAVFRGLIDQITTFVKGLLGPLGGFFSS